MNNREVVAVQFRILGPLEVVRGKEFVPIRPGSLTLVLLTLVSRAGRRVSLAELVDVLWPDRPPERAEATVRSYVAKLRRALGEPERVRWQATGYVLRVEAGELDAVMFVDLVRRARRERIEDDLGAAASHVSEALALWRGDPYDGYQDRPFLICEAGRLHEMHLQALDDRADIDVRVGRHADLLTWLPDLVMDHPEREGLVSALMRALDWTGRQTEALAVYRRTQQALADQHGIDPSSGLQALHQAILRGEGASRPPGRSGAVEPEVSHRPAGVSEAPVGSDLSGATASVVSGPSGAVGVPGSLEAPGWAGLPSRAAHFIASEDLLEELVTRLRPPDPEAGRRDGTRPVCVLHGMGGVGKTTLALEAAARLSPWYPDGALFIDLHGHDDIAAVTSGEALDRFLRQLGVPGEQIPSHAEDRAALFRRCLAGLRVLLVLDNASNAGQVSPLLPATSTCGAVITSRAHLAALDEAHHRAVTPLTRTDAVALFGAIAGADRLTDGPEIETVITRIVESCGRLPLAIRIAAARWRASQLATLDELAELLADRTTRLRSLDDGERSVAASFMASYVDLPADVRPALALLALHPGADLDSHAATALIGQAAQNVDPVLRHLRDRHLLDQAVGARYRLHDLVRAFARTYAVPTLADGDQRAATHRLVDHYLSAAEHADLLLTPHRRRIPLDLAYPPASLPELTDAADARAWMDTELANLTSVCLAAAEHGLDAQCWQLAYTLRGYFFLTKHWEPWRTTHQAALVAARRCGDKIGQANTLNNLGLAAIEQGRYDIAAGCYQQALDLFREVANRHGEHTALANLAWISYYQGDYERFLQDSRVALDFYQQNNADVHAAITLRGIGLAETELGRTSEALEHLHQALGTFHAIDSTLDVAMTQNALGEAHARHGSQDRASHHHQLALSTANACGSAYETARAHHRLGDLRAGEGDSSEARRHWTRALGIFERLDAPQTDRVRQQLMQDTS